MNPSCRLGVLLVFVLALCGSSFWSGAVEAKPWKGAEIITHETFKYGAFEARIRGAEGSGMITAFFLWKDGSELSGTEWQEQDFEIFGADGRYQSQVMTPGDPRTEHVETRSLATPAWENYYTFRMEWTPDYLAFYVDGHLVRTETDPVEYAKLLDPDRAEPAQLRLSLWAGDFDWSGPFDASYVPAAAFIEYCEVFAYTPGAGPAGGDFTSRWRDEFDTLNPGRWWFANWTFEYAVNDYVSGNAAAIDGKAVLVLTDEANVGTFPSIIPPDNPPLPPVGGEEPAPPPVVIPGRVEAEFVSAYDDTTTGNLGDAECGSSDLDVGITGDEGGGCNVGWTARGEWVEYEVDVAARATFDVVLRVATAEDGKAVRVEVDGTDVSGRLDVPSMDDWQSYSDVSFELDLAEGVHTVRVVFVTGLTNLNYLEFREADPSVGPDPVQLPARIEAEAFTAAYDDSSGNEGDDACDTGDVDSQVTGDVDGGCNIGWTAAGEWTEYAVQVPSDSDYVLRLRVATEREDVIVHVEVDGVDVSGSLGVPQAGWQTYFDVEVPMTLSAGAHAVRIVYDSGYANLNYLEFLDAEPNPPPQCDEPKTIYEAESMAASTGGPVSDGWNLWSNGSLTVEHSFHGGATVLGVWARGEAAAGVAPHMVVRVGDQVIGEVEVASEEHALFEFYYDAPVGARTVAIEFDNDYYQGGEDRNLILDALEIDACP